MVVTTMMRLLVVAGVAGSENNIAFVIFGNTHHWRAVKGRKEECPTTPRGIEIQWVNAAKRSQRKFVLDVVNASFDQVDVFLSVDKCEQDNHTEYEPYLRGVATSGTKSPRVLKLQKGLRLLDRANRRYSYVVLTRPDLLWYEPVDTSRLVAPRGIVWPSKCEPKAWDEFQCVSDIFISAAGDAFSHLREKCSKELFDKFISSGHYTYRCALRNDVITKDNANFYVGNESFLVINTREHPTLLFPFYIPGGSYARQNLKTALSALKDRDGLQASPAPTASPHPTAVSRSDDEPSPSSAAELLGEGRRLGHYRHSSRVPWENI